MIDLISVCALMASKLELAELLFSIMIINQILELLKREALSAMKTPLTSAGRTQPTQLFIQKCSETKWKRNYAKNE